MIKINEWLSHCTQRERTLMLLLIITLILSLIYTLVFEPALTKMQDAKNNLEISERKLSEFLDIDRKLPKAIDDSIAINALKEEEIQNVIASYFNVVPKDILYALTSKERDGIFHSNDIDIYSERVRFTISNSEIMKVIKQNFIKDAPFIVDSISCDTQSDNSVITLRFFSYNKHHDFLFASDEDTFNYFENINHDNVSEVETDTKTIEESEVEETIVNNDKAQKEKSIELPKEQEIIVISDFKEDSVLKINNNLSNAQSTFLQDGGLKISFYSIKNDENPTIPFEVEFYEPKPTIYYPPDEMSITIGINERSTDTIGLILICQNGEIINSPIVESIGWKGDKNINFKLNIGKEKYPVKIGGIYYQHVGGYNVENELVLKHFEIRYDK